jgi:protein phosphatase
VNRLEQTTIPVTALSHPGIKRKNNEDRYGVSAFTLGPGGPDPILLAVLSDGIGGHRAGEVASEMTVNLVSQVVAASDGRNPPAILERAFEAASEAIRDQAASNPNQAGMGATCACAWIIGNRLYIATVGDSRVYLLHDGVIRRLSTDHTWVQEAIERGLINAEEAQGHPNAHVIRRYLGSPVPPEVDLRVRVNENENDEQALANQGLVLERGDRIILCSDGLTDMVHDPEILSAFHDHPVDAASRALIDLANARGGPDNITLVAIDYPGQRMPKPAGAEKRARPPRVWRWLGVGCLSTLVVAFAAAAAFAGWTWLNGGSLSLPGASITPTLQTTIQGEPVTLPAQETAAPSPTPFVSAPAEPLATSTPPVSLPVDTGPTLTPWPTNTVVH